MRSSTFCPARPRSSALSSIHGGFLRFRRPRASGSRGRLPRSEEPLFNLVFRSKITSFQPLRRLFARLLRAIYRNRPCISPVCGALRLLSTLVVPTSRSLGTAACRCPRRVRSARVERLQVPCGAVCDGPSACIAQQRQTSGVLRRTGHGQIDCRSHVFASLRRWSRPTARFSR